MTDRPQAQSTHIFSFKCLSRYTWWGDGGHKRSKISSVWTSTVDVLVKQTLVFMKGYQLL